ncbi:hypothetical protein [Tropicibacter oceani]|uniref:Uncharacterized protein n=1 Tax=Tropicibacter oceani TaxID=3058420 RepID=A0ABY8QIL0_9RHOB|nr:hypothetical protein [Tropicibacter oceani]WGW04273.1 hypothetical protein QF118_01670 [Tropicibacter oceani]
MTDNLSEMARARRLRALTRMQAGPRRSRPLQARLFGRASRGFVGLGGASQAC